MDQGLRRPGAGPHTDGMVILGAAGNKYVSTCEPGVGWVWKQISGPSGRPWPESIAWTASTERLLDHLGKLVYERHQLLAALARALHDRDVAEARVAELERLYEVLHSERYGTKDQTNKTFLVLLATAVFTLLGPVAGEFVADALRPDLEGAKQAAQRVQVDCGDITLEIPITT